MEDLLERLPHLAAAHLRLALSALGLGLMFSLPMGALLHRRPRWRTAVLGVVGVVQTIPSLALLAFMVPVIAALAPWVEAVTGSRPSAIGSGPALVALTVYGLLPILQNTVAGLGSVEPALVEAARGVGMTALQRLLKVELPLALPVIVAGVRTAAVWTVGTAVLATPIGADSLGEYIFTGLQTRNQASIAVGCVASAALAIGLDLWIRGLERSVEQRRRRWSLTIAAGLLAVWASVTVPRWMGGDERPAARVGAKAFTEAYIMAEIFSEQLETVGIQTKTVGSLGSTVIFDALVSGDLDVYLDFTGTILFNVMKAPLPESGGRAAVLALVRDWLRREHDIRVVATLGYENRYAFAVRRARAEVMKLDNVSDLRRVAPELSLVASFEFFDRPEWAAVEDVYGLEFGERTAMEQALAYQAVQSGERDVVVAYSTDARIDAFDLVLLEDDKRVIPPYEAIVLVRGAFADAHPEAVVALSELEGAFTEAEVRALNGAVDRDGESVEAAARAWLRAHP